MVAVVVVVCGLLALRFGGSPVAKWQLNRKLTGLPGYSAHVDGVKLAFWRGAVDVVNFVAYEKGHEDEGPIVCVNKAAIKFEPGPLFTRKVGGAVVIDGVEVNGVKREPSPAKEENPKAAPVKTVKQVERWQDTFRNAFPLRLTKVEIKNLKFRFIDRTHQPNVDVGIDRLHLVAVDLQNRSKANGDPLTAKIELTGVTTGDGQLHATVRLDPLSETPHFTAAFEVRDLSLPSFNSFVLAYINADVSKGSFEMASEIKAEGGAYEGYVKPLFKDLDFRTASDKDKSAAQLFTKKVVAGVAGLLKTRDQNQIVTKAPFRGIFADNRVDIWTTITNLFHTAFVQASTGGGARARRRGVSGRRPRVGADVPWRFSRRPRRAAPGQASRTIQGRAIRSLGKTVLCQIRPNLACASRPG